MFLLVDNYDSFTYNLYALFKAANAKVFVIKNDDFLEADEFDGIIISPGPSNPQNSGYSLEYIEKYASKKPIFGVCLGMQCIATYLNGNVRQSKRIMHGKIDTIKCTTQSKILENLPKHFKAVRYHSLAVDIGKRFICAVADADGEVMAIEDHNSKLYGVQFHPESIKSEYGLQIIKNFINLAGGDND